MIKQTITLSTLLLAGLLVSFNSKKLSNNPKTVEKTMKADYAFIPSGNALVGNDTVSVQSFYIGKGEVTNKSYNEFLTDLKAKGEMENYAIAKNNTEAWDLLGTDFDPFKNQYASHELYQFYPVVNVTYEGAQLYCEWLSAKMEKETEGLVQLVFRIPLQAEWLRAARGDDHQAAYAHGNTCLKNASGCLIANFKHIGDERIHYNGEKDQYEMLPVDFATNCRNTDNIETLEKAISYNPNKFGVYNLNGNAAEMISAKGMAVGGNWLSTGYDIRNESIEKVTGAHPTVGFRVVATYY
jgi:formylglycine-generating enzyme required for sulfatase activity